MKNFNDMTTDELLEELPNNLHLARNGNAREDDRWRIFNSHTGQYVEPGYATARELLVRTCNRLDEQFRSWTSN